MAHSISTLNNFNIKRVELKIYCPEWYRKLMVCDLNSTTTINNNGAINMFMGIEFVVGYEDAIVIANTGSNKIKIGNPTKITRIEIFQ